MVICIHTVALEIGALANYELANSFVFAQLFGQFTCFGGEMDYNEVSKEFVFIAVDDEYIVNFNANNNHIEFLFPV